MLALQQLQDFEGSCLHLAPEEWLKPLVRAKAGRVFTADIDQAGVDLRLDLEALPFPAGSLEVIICSDVLEHVEDDGRAMAEMRRVLKPGSGLAIVHVPVVARDTVEYGFPVGIDHGHRRAYGPDVAARLRLAGLDVIEYGARQLPRGAARRHGLFPGDRVFLARTAPARVEADTVLV